MSRRVHNRHNYRLSSWIILSDKITAVTLEEMISPHTHSFCSDIAVMHLMKSKIMSISSLTLMYPVMKWRVSEHYQRIWKHKSYVPWQQSLIQNPKMLSKMSRPSFSALHWSINTTTSVPYWPRTSNTSYQSAMGHFIPFTTGPRCQGLKVSVCLRAHECNMAWFPVALCEVLNDSLCDSAEDPSSRGKPQSLWARRAEGGHRGRKYSQSTERTDSL